MANVKSPSKKTPSKKPKAAVQAKLPFSPTKSPAKASSPKATTSSADSDEGVYLYVKFVFVAYMCHLKKKFFFSFYKMKVNSKIKLLFKKWITEVV